MRTRRWWLLAVAVCLLPTLAVPVLTQTPTPTRPSDQKAAKKDAADTAEKKEKNEPPEKVNARKAAEQAAAAHLPAVLMPEPTDVRTLDLSYGIGGKDHAPDPDGVYTFISEDLNQSSPKFDVRDAQGRKWRVKMGEEVRAETAASRLVWAAGYFTNQDYYLPQIKVKNLPKLKRGGKHVTGNVAHVVRMRLEPKDEKNIGYWKWTANPFLDTREFNGLRVMMALINNWDLIERNNKIFQVNGQRRYVVSDLGATFGRSGNEFTRKKDNFDAYEGSKFIVKITAETVDFSDHSRPLPFGVFAGRRLGGVPDYYRNLVAGQKVVKDIPLADAKWIADRLAQLSDDQIRDCFRVSGYSPEEVEDFTKVVRQRIVDLTAL
jgi:hypothetical protein